MRWPACVLGIALVAPGFADCKVEPGTTLYAIPVRAMTENMKVADGLQAGNFTVTDKGVPVPICAFAHGPRPTSIGIVLDISGSMDNVVFRLAKAGISQLLETSGPDDEYFLQYVNETPVATGGFTSDIARIRSGLDAKRTGKTALVDAIRLAVDAMRKARHANRALVVMTDGYDNVSTHSQKDLAAVFSAAPVPIFLIVPAADPTERWRATHVREDERRGREEIVSFVKSQRRLRQMGRDRKGTVRGDNSDGVRSSLALHAVLYAPI